MKSQSFSDVTFNTIKIITKKKKTKKKKTRRSADQQSQKMFFIKYNQGLGVILISIGKSFLWEMRNKNYTSIRNEQKSGAKIRCSPDCVSLFTYLLLVVVCSR